MAPQDYQPKQQTVVAAVLTVAATYVYFLLFAQFGFLKIVQALAGDGREVIGPIMAAMGLAGIAGSILAARIYRVERCRRHLVAGLAVCAAAAGWAIAVRSTGGLYLAAASVGLGTGFTTVILACGLRRAVGGGRLGTVIGLGTGIAYGFCNLPAVFTASANTQAAVALLVAVAGMGAAGWLAFDAPRDVPAGIDYSWSGQTGWTLIFLLLVALDSAAFNIIQHTPALKAETWSGPAKLEMNALVHLVAALLAGFALDRRWVGRTIGLGALALLGAIYLWDMNNRAFAEGALFYTAGVSIYSTILVYYPACGLRPSLTALIYAVAGWGGSGLGVVLAADRHGLPRGLAATAAGIILALLLTRHFLRWRERSGEN
jgi:cytochrome c oxidase cbb3-type subunit 2